MPSRLQICPKPTGKRRIFQLQVAHLKANPEAGQQLQRREQDIRKEIQRLEHSISTLRTNMDFFAKSKNADQIRSEYTQRIEETQQKVQDFKRQLNLLRKNG